MTMTHEHAVGCRFRLYDNETTEAEVATAGLSGALRCRLSIYRIESRDPVRAPWPLFGSVRFAVTDGSRRWAGRVGPREDTSEASSEGRGIRYCVFSRTSDSKVLVTRESCQLSRVVFHEKRRIGYITATKTRREDVSLPPAPRARAAGGGSRPSLPSPVPVPGGLASGLWNFGTPRSVKAKTARRIQMLSANA